jgi:hypothetical protein
VPRGQGRRKPTTWRTLIEVLRNKVVNEGVMADELEAKKYPGNTLKGT